MRLATITPFELLNRVDLAALVEAVASYQSSPGDKYYQYECKRAKKLIKTLCRLSYDPTLKNYVLVGRIDDPQDQLHSVKVQLLRKADQWVDVANIVEASKGLPQLYLQECIDSLHDEEYIHEHRYEAIVFCECDAPSLLLVGDIPFLANIIAQMLNPDRDDLW